MRFHLDSPWEGFRSSGRQKADIIVNPAGKIWLGTWSPFRASRKGAKKEPPVGYRGGSQKNLKKFAALGDTPWKLAKIKVKIAKALAGRWGLAKGTPACGEVRQGGGFRVPFHR
ncbi:MAG: hypothetical protein LBL95_02550 [Deltaproteobacteria bacterium]|nr:hypothetical protein [Deltaproteobacteria bacterium]